MRFIEQGTQQEEDRLLALYNEHKAIIGNYIWIGTNPYLKISESGLVRLVLSYPNFNGLYEVDINRDFLTIDLEKLVKKHQKEAENSSNNGNGDHFWEGLLRLKGWQRFNSRHSLPMTGEIYIGRLGNPLGNCGHYLVSREGVAISPLHLKLETSGQSLDLQRIKTDIELILIPATEKSGLKEKKKLFDELKLAVNPSSVNPQ